ncbi:MAG TPA: hypothetical protein VK929_16635 [Longimicrobiales bacterium]|nr:hypothetical protein [Longimicrobiales bacterium]
MSQTLVLKFGGTSLGTPNRLRRAALRVRRHRREGRAVVVVVSAPGSTTDRITRWLDTSAPAAARERASGREHDRALATGEDLAAALLAAALGSVDVPALSLRGGEAGIEATGEHRAGELHRVCGEKLRTLLDAGTVPVVAGFQAVRADGETVTLGRGASDLTAVAIAGALAAECHIVTDVDGIYNADPQTTPDARRFDRMTHAALVSLAQRGGRVVHADAACHAARRGVPLRVYHFRSRLNQPPATLVSGPPARQVNSARHVACAPVPPGVAPAALPKVERSA